MYRIFKSLFVSFLFIFTLISNFGCSSSKSVKIKYTVNVIKENEEEAKMHNLGMSVVLNKKFRESIDTPCYEKIITTYTFDSDFSQVTFGENNKLLVYDNTIEINDKIYRVDLENKVLKYNDEKIVIKNNKFEITKYELMKNSEGVSKCYNSVGEEFERATLNKVDKIELSKENPLVKNNNTNHFESTLQEIPINEKHSLIYNFIITNHDIETIYIRKMNVNSLINNQLEESGYLKIIGNFICDEVIDIENNTYYKLDKDDTLSIEIKIKGLNKSELSKGVKNINLDFSLFVRYN